LGRKRVGGYILENYEDWKKRIDIEVATLDQAIAILKTLRDATALSSFPCSSINRFRIARKQPNEDKNDF
jgi:hypothetical protein